MPVHKKHFRVRGAHAAAMLLSALAGTPRAIDAQNAPPRVHLSPAEWRADLRALADGIRRVHPAPFKWSFEQRFDSMVANLERRIPTLTDEQVKVELTRLVASLADGHTTASPLVSPDFGFHRLPVRFYLFSDGLFVRSAAPEQAALAGARVIKVGRLSADSALRLVAPLVSRENGMWEASYAPEYLAIPEVLHALGISDSSTSVRLELELRGRRQLVRVAATTRSSVMLGHSSGIAGRYDAGWIESGHDGAVPIPLYQRGATQPFTLEWIGAAHTIYVQYNQVGDGPEETVAHFAARVRAMIDTLPAEKLALDIRLNSGGNSFFNRYLTRAIIGSRIDHPGGFFVIIGRQTFSAAQLLVENLEANADAIYVGEPTGNRINFFGDHVPVLLPNSGISIMVATLWWQRDQRDTRVWKAPDYSTSLSSTDFAAHIDPALDVVLNWGPHYTVAGRAMEAVRAATSTTSTDDIVTGLAKLPEFAYANIEAGINAAAYALIRAGKIDNGLQLLQANSRAFPSSANAFDSLGEVLLARGDTAAATQAYIRAVTLQPGFPPSAAALTRLGKKP